MKLNYIKNKGPHVVPPTPFQEKPMSNTATPGSELRNNYYMSPFVKK